jgi:hypothetical protein
MRPEPDETSVSLRDALSGIHSDDQPAVLVAELLRLLCVEDGYSLVSARKIVAHIMGGLYPHIAFDRMPVAARMQ